MPRKGIAHDRGVIGFDSQYSHNFFRGLRLERNLWGRPIWSALLCPRLLNPYNNPDYFIELIP